MSISITQPTHTNLWPDELKILSVDNDQESLNLIRQSLEPAGFRVLRTTKAEEGLDLALHEKPDMLLLDIYLSDLDGLELLRRIRRHPKLAQIPAIIISARAGNTDQIRILQLSECDQDNIAAYIGKPFAPDILLNTVKAVLVAYKEVLLDKNRAHTRPWEVAPVSVPPSHSTLTKAAEISQ